ncbi:unnamed protein product, partial [marine sediment metagenome]
QTGGIGKSAGGPYESSGGFLAQRLIGLINATPADQESLWRSQKNIMRLTFDGDIMALEPGDLRIEEMLEGGNYGADLSANFTFTVETDTDDNPRILKIQENGAVLEHRTWYAVRNVGDWSDVADFILQYVVQVGDADKDGQVLTKDILTVNVVIPTFSAADDDRRDIDGDGRILTKDILWTNVKIPSFAVSKPSGH